MKMRLFPKKNRFIFLFFQHGCGRMRRMQNQAEPEQKFHQIRQRQMRIFIPQIHS